MRRADSRWPRPSFLLLTAGCGLVGGDGDAITIGALYPMSGSQGPGGVEESRGAQVAVELVNRDGGVNGRKVKLKLVDVDVGSAAPKAMRDLHADGVDLVIGTYGSTISAPAAEVAAQEGMLLWETGAVGEMTGPGAGESFFRIAPQGGHLGRGAVEFIRDQLAPMLGRTDPLRWAVAYVDDLYGRPVGEGAVAEVERGGGVLAGSFPYDVHRYDAAELVGRIAESRPDVLFVSAYLDDGVALREATLDAHLPLVASIGTSSSYCMRAFAAKLGAGAVGLFASDKPDGPQMREDALTPEGRSALSWARDRYKQRFNDEMTAAALAGFAHTYALVGPRPARLARARAGPGGRHRPLAEAPDGHPGQRLGARPGRARRARRRGEPGGGERDLAVGRPRRPGGRLAGGAGHPAAPAHSHPDLMASKPDARRPLAVGLGLGALYAIVAVATLLLADRPLLPLFDGLAPPPPYRWVKPPPEVAADNQQPTSAQREAPLGPEGSPFLNVTPEDGQAVVVLEAGAVPPNPPETGVRVAVTPHDAGTLGDLPDGLTAASNAYQVAISLPAVGSGGDDGAVHHHGVVGRPDRRRAERRHALSRPTATNWTRRPDPEPLLGGHGLKTPLETPGYYLVASIDRSPGRRHVAGGVRPAAGVAGRRSSWRSSW